MMERSIYREAGRRAGGEGRMGGRGRVERRSDTAKGQIPRDLKEGRCVHAYMCALRGEGYWANT